MDRHAVIVGGGLAGLAAAEALAASGWRVTLLESRPRLGGRASSFEDKETGTQIDNCQHVSLGCCTNFQHFCERTGLSSAFRTERELTFVAADGQLNRLVASSLPAPFHLAPAFHRLSFLSWRDRLALAQGLARLAWSSASKLNGETIDRWLARHGQTENVVNRVWNVVLVSALSESLDRISTAHARKVFVDAFLANRDGWTVQLPTVPLDELYGRRLTAHLEERGATIRTLAGVNRLLNEGDRVTGAELRSGEVITGDDFILAVPHHLIRGLLPPDLACLTAIRDLEQLDTAPISSVHLWFDRPITDLPHAVLVDRLSQWMFNRTAIQQQAPVDGRYYYQVVISASRELEGTPSADTIAAVRDELVEVWPAVAEARLLHSRVVTEHRAVFSATPEAESLRLPQQSPFANLQFAGDWTRTGWPSTMEGAVRSGYLAAENILRRFGGNDQFVQPDLSAAPLARLLLGIR